jgi:hypothetical protein
MITPIGTLLIIRRSGQAYSERDLDHHRCAPGERGLPPDITEVDATSLAIITQQFQFNADTPPGSGLRGPGAEW